MPETTDWQTHTLARELWHLEHPLLAERDWHDHTNREAPQVLKRSEYLRRAAVLIANGWRKPEPPPRRVPGASWTETCPTCGQRAGPQVRPGGIVEFACENGHVFDPLAQRRRREGLADG
jgi:hypothetical protein